MKKIWSLFLFIFTLFANATYQQQSQVLVFANNKSSETLIHKIFDKFEVQYADVASLDVNNNTSLHIITGNGDSYRSDQLPKYYILYQTATTQNYSENHKNVMKNAIAVWDVSWNNINQYRSQITNYYYLPNENYEFLDPVLLSCFIPTNALPTYRSLLQYSNASLGDFISHIPTLFCHCLLENPAIIVEAGVRGGDGSTIALQEIPTLIPAHLIGLDIVDCSRVYSKIINSRFVQIDDLVFPDYFKTLRLKKNTVDFVFIDTSHELEHTYKEIEVFASILSEHGVLAFHDSNVTPLNNGSSYQLINNNINYVGAVNPRGVTAALKKYFNFDFNEYAYNNTTVQGGDSLWQFIHYPYCNGLTIVKRLK